MDREVVMGQKSTFVELAERSYIEVGPVRGYVLDELVFPRLH